MAVRAIKTNVKSWDETRRALEDIKLALDGLPEPPEGVASFISPWFLMDGVVSENMLRCMVSLQQDEPVFGAKQLGLCPCGIIKGNVITNVEWWAGASGYPFLAFPNSALYFALYDSGGAIVGMTDNIRFDWPAKARKVGALQSPWEATYTGYVWAAFLSTKDNGNPQMFPDALGESLLGFAVKWSNPAIGVEDELLVPSPILCGIDQNGVDGYTSPPAQLGTVQTMFAVRQATFSVPYVRLS